MVKRHTGYQFYKDRNKGTPALDHLQKLVEHEKNDVCDTVNDVMYIERVSTEGVVERTRLGEVRRSRNDALLGELQRIHSQIIRKHDAEERMVGDRIRKLLLGDE